MYNSEEEEEYISIFDNSNNIHEITLNENLFNILTSDFNNSKVLSPIRYNINKINDIKVIKEPNVSELTEEEFKVIQKSHCILDKQYEICSREMMNRNKKENRTYIPRKNQNYKNQYYNSQYRNNFQYNEEERTMCSKKRYRSYNQY